MFKKQLIPSVDTVAAKRKYSELLTKQAVRVATQYASAPCKLTISSHLFPRWHLFQHDGYLRHQQL